MKADTPATVRHQEADLRPDQEEAIAWLREHPFSHVWIDMGMGKTVTILTLLIRMLADDIGAFNKVLIVAPIKVALQTWPAEIAAWGHTYWLPHTVIRPENHWQEIAEAANTAAREARSEALIELLPPSAYDGAEARLAAVLHRLADLLAPELRRVAGKIASKAGTDARTAKIEEIRRRLAVEKTPIHIINREALPWLIGFYGPKRWPYDVVIVDESSCLRAHDTERFKALKRVRSRIKRIHLLTGTPRPESYTDVFAPTWLLDQGQRLGSYPGKFKKKYFDYDQYTRRLTPKEGTGDRIAALLADITIVMENHYIPDPLVIPRPVTLDHETMQRVSRFEREMVLETPAGEEIEALTSANLSQKMLQLASGSVYDADKKTHFVHNAKIEELHELVEEADGQPMIVCYWFKSSLQMLQKAFPKAVTMDKAGRAVVPWNEGKIKMLFQHPASGGHGLNQQFGGHIMVFFDNPWPLELYLQIIARLNRPGQLKRVLVYHIMTLGTRDEDVVPCLAEKRDAQEVLTKRVAELRANYGKK